ncbi:TAXI family TRAP transporter solute-binding subunit [Actinomadura kijaniata]|uniref:TAXI family TRAP transporter solute-binding subunit n=1 Tax=Actinomadura kijaniata TaxID=46161 RepID=UPI000835414B|nr:TAXI family TRAP transporter solute-binding subunit [Actinomadura kijaniata]
MTGLRRRTLLALPLMAAACDLAPPPPLDRLTIATGGQGGVYHTLGTAYAAAAARRWHADARVLTTAASVENLRLVADGRADVGFTTVDSAALAVRGEGAFTHPLPVVALAGLYDDYLQVVVRADGPVREMTHLRGRRVSTGSPDSGTEVVATRVLEAIELDPDRGIDRRRMSAADSAEALRKDEIDAFFFTGGLPTPAVANLTAATRIRILSMRHIVDGLQQQYGEVYQTRSIPANTYALGEEVITVGIANVLVVRSDMGGAKARALTALLFDAKPTLVKAHAEARRLDHRTATATYPVALHPGAARYYRDSKVMVTHRGR